MYVLELPGDLRGLQVPHDHISLLVQVRDILPEAIHSVLPSHGGISLAHNASAAAYRGNRGSMNIQKAIKE